MCAAYLLLFAARDDPIKQATTLLALVPFAVSLPIEEYGEGGLFAHNQRRHIRCTGSHIACAMLASLLFSLSTGVRQEAKYRRGPGEAHSIRAPIGSELSGVLPSSSSSSSSSRTVCSKERSEQLLRQEFAYRTQPIAIAPAAVRRRTLRLSGNSCSVGNFMDLE